MKWEYNFYVPSKDTPNSLSWNGDDLNALGKQGWEAVCVIGDSSLTACLLMKRPLAAAPEPPGPPESA